MAIEEQNMRRVTARCMECDGELDAITRPTMELVEVAPVESETPSIGVQHKKE